MTFVRRLQVWLARQLCRGTACCVVRESQAKQTVGLASDLWLYVQASGGLHDPRRIRAYRQVLDFSAGIVQNGREMLT